MVYNRFYGGIKRQLQGVYEHPKHTCELQTYDCATGAVSTILAIHMPLLLVRYNTYKGLTPGIAQLMRYGSGLPLPLSIKHGTRKTVKARNWP